MDKKVFMQNPVIVKWLDRLGSKATKRSYGDQLHRYFVWRQQHGLEADLMKVLQDQERRLLKADSITERVKHTDEAWSWVKSLGHSEGYRNAAWSAVKSFYAKNDLALQGTEKYAGLIKIQRKVFSKPAATWEQAKQRIQCLHSKKSRNSRMYEAAYMILLKSGMRIGDLCNAFNVVPLSTGLLEKLDILKIELETDAGIKYFTYIDREAIEAILRYLYEVRGLKKGDMVKPPIFVNRNGEPLKEKNLMETMIALNKSLGDEMFLKEVEGIRRGVFSCHDFRKVFRTACTQAGLEERFSEFFLGHSEYVSGLKAIYDKSPELYEKQFENEYRKVSNQLLLWKPPEKVNPVAERTITRLEEAEEKGWITREERKLLEETVKVNYDGWDEEDYENMKQTVHRPQKAERREMERKQKTRKATKPNGGKPYESRIVGEADLLGFLDEGWELIKEVGQGRFIVRRRNNVSED